MHGANLACSATHRGSFHSTSRVSFLRGRTLLRRPGSLRSTQDEKEPAEGGGNEEQEQDRIDEETISRLQKAEEESERLRRELASLRAAKSKEAALSKAGRTLWSSAPFDSKDLRRETIFESNNKTGNWLSEADVEFLTGEGGNGLTAEEQAIVNRRLAIGGVLSAVFVVFALIPTEKFQLLKPRGTVTTYLVPVLRAQDLLIDCRPLIENAEWDGLRVGIDRIINVPNNLKQNLDSATAFLEDEDLRRRGRGLSTEVLEFVQEMDYNKYFEDRLNKKEFRDGAEEARFVEFSQKALDTAMKRLKQYLNLFPVKEVETARNVINSSYE